jgi:D-alanyl-D-alanine carboxypeptidase (penicillin-binding protein 5/6)
MVAIRIRHLFVGALVIAPLVGHTVPAGADEPSTRARQAIVIEYPTKRVLFEKRADRRMAPSSMTKLMTAFLIFEGLRKKTLRLDEPVKISRRAARQRGSTLSLKRGQTVPLGDLLRATIVHSANDAAVALAERVAGSEAKFARRMSKRAKQLGLKKSRFRNATGFTRKGHRMSARDVALMAGLIIAKFPNYYRYFGERSFSFGGKTYTNRNPLLGAAAGVDGLKTGQTRAGGYGLVVSAKRGPLRLILVVNGLKSAAARKREAARLLEWSFKQAAAKR